MQKNRIVFAGNPWPEGHAIKELDWSARLDPDSGLWFDLHLESDDYYAEDDDDEDDEEEDEAASDWDAKGVWSNYHSCTLSSTAWGHAGFLAGTAEHPVDFAQLADRTFHVDPLPAADDPYERSFGIYLLGHDGAADHHIRFSPVSDNLWELDWSGKIALEYIGNDTFDRSFQAHSDQLKFSGIELPEGTKPAAALSMLAPFATNIDGMKPTERDGALWLALP